MKIGASSVSFAASHSASMRSEVRETLRGVWVGERHAAQRPEEGVVPSSVVDLSSAATSAAYTGRQAPEANAIEEARKAIENDPMLYLIRLVVEMMTGVKIKIVSAGEMKAV
jgi:hypothetical protein